MPGLMQTTTNEQLVEFLRLNPFFAKLDDTALEDISRLMVARNVDKNEIIWLEQETARMVYFTASGLIKLFKISIEGKEQILRLARPGDCFGCVGVFNGGSNPENAQALVPSLLYGLTKDSLETFLREHQQLALNTIRSMAIEMHHYLSLIEDLSLRDVRGRLAKMLLEHSNEDPDEAPLVLTQTNMAAMIGTVREVIGKSVKSLEEDGAIRANRRKIVIEDSDVLRTIAGLE
jgi:CRP-like cAMP-binding protein